MNLTQMRYFSAVCKLGNITRAAERLHVSQPAISIAIKELEKELDVALLHRGKRVLVPTPEGERFLERSECILADVDKLQEEFHKLSQTQSTIEVGIPPMIGAFLYPFIFTTFHQKYPGITLLPTETGSEHTKELVRKGDLTLGIIAMGDAPPPGLEAEILFQTEMKYCVAKDHTFASKPYVTLEDMKGQPIVLFSSGYYHERMVRERFQEQGVTPQIMCISNQLSTIKSFVRKNMATAFLLPQVIHPHDDIVSLSVREPLHMNIGVIWRKGSFLTREAKRLIAFVKTSFEELDDN